jgi:type IX secretion system PorP/SprF family membrane protein
VQAQYDAQFSQYYMAMGYYNPAFAGISENLNVLADSRIQWVGIEGAPKSVFVMADMPFRFRETSHGAGVIVFSESIGLFRNTHVAAQYAFKRKLFGGTLSIGLQAGMASQAFDGTKIEMPENTDYYVKTDEALPATEVSAMALDANAGLFFSHKRFYAGIGALHLTRPQMQLDENAYAFIPRMFNLTGGYNIQMANPLFEVQPSLFVKTDLYTFQADFTARLVYNKMFNGGVSWRMNESVIILLGAAFDRFQVGYAYDFPTSPILRGSSGSHELTVRFSIKVDKEKTGKNKHKSVRIL